MQDQAITKVSYTHEAMIDLLLANPMITQGAVARYFGYTEPWISRILSSDAFKEMYAKRKNELVDPVLAQNIETRLEALCLQSIEVLERKLEASPSADVAIKTLEVTARAKGYGVAKSPQAQFSFVVHMPTKSASPGEWVTGTQAPDAGGGDDDKHGRDGQWLAAVRQSQPSGGWRRVVQAWRSHGG